MNAQKIGILVNVRISKHPLQYHVMLHVKTEMEATIVCARKVIIREGPTIVLAKVKYFFHTIFNLLSLTFHTPEFVLW